MSIDGRTMIIEATISAMFGELTREELARTVRWINATYVDSRRHSPDLHPREVTVLQMHAYGHGVRSIGQACHVSDTTVRRDMQSIMSKLGADNPTHLIVVAARAGLL